MKIKQVQWRSSAGAHKFQKACPALMTHQSLQSPRSVSREELDITLSRRVDPSGTDGLVFPSQPWREVPWDLPQETLKLMQWSPKRSREQKWHTKHPRSLAASAGAGPHCDAITLFSTSHLYWKCPRAAPTQPDTFPCQVTGKPLKTMCW